MNKPRKHAELIKAWADGADIQMLVGGTTDDWQDQKSPGWHPGNKFRIKPSVEIPEGFIPWEGGLCPVDEKSIVEIILRRGAHNRDRAGLFIWANSDHQSDIIAYKVIKNAPVVRWQWIVKRTEGSLYVTSDMDTEDDIRKWAKLAGVEVIGRAEWTRTEFDN